MLLHYYFIGIEHLMAQMVKNLLQYRRPRLNPLGRKIPGEGNGYPLQYSCLPAAAAKSLRLCLTLCDPIDSSPPGSPIPWDSPGKNTGVGCHFLLQCMKVKSESEVTQSCPTLRDTMDCSLPGSSAHGIFQARVLPSLQVIL